jgi:hypothetical protein
MYTCAVLFSFSFFVFCFLFFFFSFFLLLAVGFCFFLRSQNITSFVCLSYYRCVFVPAMSNNNWIGRALDRVGTLFRSPLSPNSTTTAAASAQSEDSTQFRFNDAKEGRTTLRAPQDNHSSASSESTIGQHNTSSADAEPISKDTAGVSDKHNEAAGASMSADAGASNERAASRKRKRRRSPPKHHQQQKQHQQSLNTQSHKHNAKSGADSAPTTPFRTPKPPQKRTKHDSKTSSAGRRRVMFSGQRETFHYDYTSPPCQRHSTRLMDVRQLSIDEIKRELTFFLDKSFENSRLRIERQGARITRPEELDRLLDGEELGLRTFADADKLQAAHDMSHAELFEQLKQFYTEDSLHFLPTEQLCHLWQEKMKEDMQDAATKLEHLIHSEMFVRDLVPVSDLSICASMLRDALAAENKQYEREDKKLKLLKSKIESNTDITKLRTNLEQEHSALLQQELRLSGLDFDVTGSHRELVFRFKLWKQIQHRALITLSQVKPEQLTDAQLLEQFNEYKLALPIRFEQDHSAGEVRHEMEQRVARSLLEDLQKGAMKYEFGCKFLCLDELHSMNNGTLLNRVRDSGLPLPPRRRVKKTGTKKFLRTDLLKVLKQAVIQRSQALYLQTVKDHLRLFKVPVAKVETDPTDLDDLNQFKEYFAKLERCVKAVSPDLSTPILPRWVPHDLHPTAGDTGVRTPVPSIIPPSTPLSTDVQRASASPAVSSATPLSSNGESAPMAAATSSAPVLQVQPKKLDYSAVTVTTSNRHSPRTSPRNSPRNSPLPIVPSNHVSPSSSPRSRKRKKQPPSQRSGVSPNHEKKQSSSSSTSPCSSPGIRAAKRANTESNGFASGNSSSGGSSNANVKRKSTSRSPSPSQHRSGSNNKKGTPGSSSRVKGNRKRHSKQ